MASVLSAPHFHNEDEAFKYVEARLWPEGPVCPHCGGVERISKMQGKSTRPGLYKCYQCRKPFTVRMGTVFESSHVPLRLWLQAMHLICASKKGISTRQLQRMLGVGLKTAWFLGHRIREAMKESRDIFTPRMGGEGQTVEADETFVGRKADSKAFKPPVEKAPVMALVERGGSVRSFHVANVRGETIRAVLAQHVSRDSNLMTDEWRAYTYIGHNFASHGTVTHREKEYVRGDIHTNTVEGFFSILKRGIYGVYQHVSEEHLRRYLVEFDFRYNTRIKLGVNDVQRADLALEGVKGKRLTYQTTRRSGSAQAQA